MIEEDISNRELMKMAIFPTIIMKLNDIRNLQRRISNE